MIESLKFSNFKALRQSSIQLSPFTLLLGPNGSGKSSVLQAVRMLSELSIETANEKSEINDHGHTRQSIASVMASPEEPVEVCAKIVLNERLIRVVFQWNKDQDGRIERRTIVDQPGVSDANIGKHALKWLARMRVYVLDATAIAQAAYVNRDPLAPNGHGLAGVLDDLRDNHEHRWNMLVDEFRRWLPEYDAIQFDKPSPGFKQLVLRTKRGGHRISAKELSQGTLVALALLTLAYMPEPPSLIGLEEIDRGLHPRLLRHLQDALYRLSYPESCGEKRPPIQVIATTHSPYLLDLYRDHPEEVVLAHKEGLEVKMQRLSGVEHFQEILGGAPLSEVWYSGVLGGASVKP